MKALIIIILIGIILEAVILISCIIEIIKAAKTDIKLTAFGKGTGFTVLCVALAVTVIFLALSFFSDYSDCKRKIADFKVQNPILTEELFLSDSSVNNIDMVDMLFKIQKETQLYDMEFNSSRYLAKGLSMIFWCEYCVIFILRDIVFITEKGITRVGRRKKENLYADSRDGILRINLDSPKGLSTVCKLKDTPKNREILDPYIR